MRSSFRLVGLALRLPESSPWSNPELCGLRQISSHLSIKACKGRDRGRGNVILKSEMKLLFGVSFFFPAVCHGRDGSKILIAVV